MDTILRAAAMSNILGEEWGERAVQAPFRAIASKRNQDGIERTMIGGVVLAGMCKSDGWERWHGTAILIPSHVEVPIHPIHDTIDRMMVTYLMIDQAWRQVWPLLPRKTRRRK